jgi:hypothetical protein
LPNNDMLLVYKETVAVPKEITGNNVDCFIRPWGVVNYQFARKLCAEFGGGSVSVPKRK